MKIKIHPEPWSPGVAHHIRTRAVAALAREPGKKSVSFKFGNYYVRVAR